MSPRTNLWPTCAPSPHANAPNGIYQIQKRRPGRRGLHGVPRRTRQLRCHLEMLGLPRTLLRCVDIEEDFARHIISECYNLVSEMGDLGRYFDYEAFGRELFLYDYSMGATITCSATPDTSNLLNSQGLFRKERLFYFAKSSICLAI